MWNRLEGRSGGTPELVERERFSPLLIDPLDSPLDEEPLDEALDDLDELELDSQTMVRIWSTFETHFPFSSSSRSYCA